MTNVGKRRLVYLGTIVAIIAMSGGYVAATVLVPTTVTQSASFFQGGNGGASGYTTPSLEVSGGPGATPACPGGAPGGTAAGTVTLMLSSPSGGTVCTTADFAEEFVVSFSATTATQTNSFTITT